LIFDYAVLITFILTSLLLFVVIYLRNILLRLSGKSDINDLNKFSLTILIFYFFLSFVLLGKLMLIIAMPVELHKFSLQPALFSFPSLFLVSQGIFLGFYVLCIAVIVINWNLKPVFRYTYLASVLKFVLFLALFDVIISFSGYIRLNFEYLFMHNLIDLSAFWDLNSPISKILPLSLAVMVLLLFLLTWLLRRKYRPAVYYLFLFIFICVFFTEIFLSVYNLQYIFDKKMLETGIINLLSFPYGFFTWLWFFLMLLAPGALIYGFFLMKMDKYFLNIYYARSYSLQMNQIAFVCAAGLAVTAMLPNILLFLFS